MKMISPSYKAENKGHYTPGIVSNGMLYISGQLSIDPDTRKVPDGGIEEHAALALRNLDRVLAAAGLGRGSVVQCRIYLQDIDQWDAVNRLYAEFFGDHKPARIVIPVGKLHFGCLIEMEAVAEAEVPR
ncbi:RidA family protein [Breznakiella homolactica]|uniref:RidA family protein n=1 Tax=Breznakiella homolactica TaxID=2798577 RepID=A0A7T7XND9_9SPIR|nr:RidA family protein [Breznakiella homolactica]QQO09427.1 RidA family protein [Breznakiella homolactica]